MRNLAYILVLLFSTSAFATISVTSGSNFSSSTSSSRLNDNLVTIWGGVAGESIHSAATVQNSCTLNTDKLKDCNKKQVGPNVRVQLVFTSDSEISGTAFIEVSDNRLDSTPYSSGQTVSLDFTWSQICGSMSTNDPNCATTGSVDLTFGVENADKTETDTSTLKAYLIATKVHPDCGVDSGIDGAINASIGDYSAFMGDEKIFFPGPNDSQAAPEISFCDLADGTESLPEGGDIDKVVAFYGFQDLASVDTTSKNKTMNLEGTYPNADLDPAFIDGFENNVPVFTRLAIQDEAGNILGITPSTAVVTTDSCNTADVSNPPTIFACRYATIPLEVAGLLADDVNCFIATATYGSSMHSTVEDFRAFRSKVLLKTKWGTWLVKKYYKWGSYASNYIVHSPTLKKVSRVALQPAWLFAVVSLKIGFGFTLLITLLLGAGFFMGVQKLLKIKKGAYS